jgi:hypothetical protein
MGEEKEVLKMVVTRLESAHIAYMATGSIAANFYTAYLAEWVVKLDLEDIYKGVAQWMIPPKK